jgi:hypothetical protein
MIVLGPSPKSSTTNVQYENQGQLRIFSVVLLSAEIQSTPKPIKMKQIRTSFNMITVVVLVTLTVGCATTSSTQNKESMLVASGFKVITPKTAAQQQKLQQLPPGKVAMIKRKGRTYYIFPDAGRNQAYGPREYQAYQQLRAINKLATENLETAELYQDATMNWGAWGG